uniref:Uncharacterized protein n=1 Tax=Leptobrachium leishanense TaxID=445787 RepID=A0A8C5QG56_9ANUR
LLAALGALLPALLAALGALLPALLAALGALLPSLLAALGVLFYLLYWLYVLAPQVIGIFSRATEEEYAWLTDILQSRFSVFSFYVGNSNYQNFISEASRCNFAILYHSKTRGRVNITDVTDSLYDHELEHLSETLGKRRVVVVADDLDESSWETKRRILENQPSISRLGQELFLFTKHDKQSPNLRSNVEPLVKLFHSGK